MLAIARREIKPLPKPVKKMFKKPELSGKGGFGSVFVAKDGTTKKPSKIAIKQLPNFTERHHQSNESEIYFMMTCKHDNIVKYLNTYSIKEKDEPDLVWIIMEYLEGGTLSEAAKAHKFTEAHIAYTAGEILKGIHYLHQRNYAHRDLKSSNVMMSIYGGIKIIDFGLCADFSEGPRTKMLGSPYWIPPEMIFNKPHSCPVDIWSFAVCILELFLCAPPHHISALKCMFCACTDGLIDTIPETASAEAKEFLQRCLVIDPDKRASTTELLKHPWINQSNIGDGLSIILRQIFLTSSLASIGF